MTFYLTSSLIVTILLCSLVTGFIFTYAVVVMPGFAKLGDREFIRAFQVTDGIIQANQPLFMLSWVGSILAVLSTMILGTLELSGVAHWVLLAIGACYLVGVQVMTMRVHLPLNDSLQLVDTVALDDKAIQDARLRFEKRWTFFNKVRTTIAFAVTASFLLFLVIALRS